MFDMIFVLTLLIGMAAGFSRGFLRQLTELAALYVGLAVAAQYTNVITARVSLELPTVPHYIIAAVVFFMVIAVVAGILSLVSQMLLQSDTTTRGRDQLSDTSQVSGLLVGALASAALISISIPVMRYATAASWGTWEQTRELLSRSLNSAYLVPVFSDFTPWVLDSIRPLLPSGIPLLLHGRLL